MPNIPLPPGYMYEKCLGSGGFGEVWLVRDKSGQPLACKIFQGGMWQADGRERFMKEAVRVEQLRRDYNIVEVVKVVEFFPYYSAYLMEYLPKGSTEYFQETHNIQFLKRLAAAVAKLHSCNVAHRDLKPANVRVREDGVPVILDFGVASWGDMNTATFVPAMGTIFYAPPESPLYMKGSSYYPGGTNPKSLKAFAQLDQLEPTNDPIERWRKCKQLHDTYSLGITIGAIMTGEEPFTENEELFNYLNTGDSKLLDRWLKKIDDRTMRDFVTESTAFMPLDRPLTSQLVKRYFKELYPTVNLKPISDVQSDYLCLDCGRRTTPPAKFCQYCGAPYRYIGFYLTPNREVKILPGQHGLRLLPFSVEAGLDSTVVLIDLNYGDFDAVIGRHQNATLSFPDDSDLYISRIHGRLVVKKKKITFADGAYLETFSQKLFAQKGDGREFHTPSNPSIYNSLPVGTEGLPLSGGGYLTVGSTTFTILNLFSKMEFK